MKKEKDTNLEGRHDRLVTMATYVNLSNQAGFPITSNALRYRIAKGLMNVVKIKDIEGFFIDTKEYPFDQKTIVRGPKPKNK